jgi:hypothetical protein
MPTWVRQNLGKRMGTGLYSTLLNPAAMASPRAKFFVDVKI